MCRGAFPKPRLVEYRTEQALRLGDRTLQAAEKPDQPIRDVEIALLSSFQVVVVGRSLQPDLRLHAVKPLRAAFGSREGEVRNRAGDATVAVLEWVDGDEPQKGNRCFYHGGGCRRGIEPVEKRLHITRDTGCRWRRVVHMLSPDGAGNHLHRTRRVIVPPTDLDPCHAAAAGRDQMV
jgi:hypothetical protein